MVSNEILEKYLTICIKWLFIFAYFRILEMRDESEYEISW